MDAKLEKLRDLLNQQADLDAQIQVLIGNAPVQSRRGRPKKNGAPNDGTPSLPLQTGEEQV